MQLLGARALPEQRGAAFVAGLVPGAGDTEQLVDADRGEEREAAHPVDQRGGRQRFMPALAAPLGGQRVRRKRPRRRLEDVPIRDVSVREHMLDVVAERPELIDADEVDRRGGDDDLVIVVDQLQQRLLHVARPRLEDHVAASDFCLDRRVLQDRDQAAALLAGEDVVEILEGAGTRARMAMLDRLARGRYVLPG